MEILKLKTNLDVEVYINGDYEIETQVNEYKYLRVKRIFAISNELYVEGNLWRSCENLKIPQRILQHQQLVFATSNVFKMSLELIKREVTIVSNELYQHLHLIPHYQNLLYSSHFYNLASKRFKLLEKDFQFCSEIKQQEIDLMILLKENIQKKMGKLNGHRGRFTVENCASYFSFLKIARNWGEVEEGERTVRIRIFKERSQVDSFLGENWDYKITHKDRFKFLSELKIVFNKKTKNISFSFLYLYSEQIFSEEYRDKCFQYEIKKLK